MQSVKSIQFRCAASADLRALFEHFRLMCNDAIRIAIEHKPAQYVPKLLEVWHLSTVRRTDGDLSFLRQSGG